ncbi:sigma-54 dependent transcriptional regulator [Venenivibrio stagnispumantis]|uniref:DNA-binding transcriptional response regulator, NtrC family, contains REC, AAA-type ATPase, and a Fis-type DNA-binding domains n=1 Tax=Venenivibrio stagnispumantis TaxID=407998 RepID=A0AA46ADT2_9AQUI|nr:sigma-54 dependent transcriptional regulator [Venenivibrio stagnispumantis]MCW4572993.1 sigma-54 dependent transcriptional regulator [Venenivibrio stagnispumantis]SMP07908.1 DNA-binding transcriptional response regulator, NtrC family, contains REC, AAA-type ATPase, and a Fis-type DNA-binding domains [Venenivibrio stagnispumantis]
MNYKGYILVVDDEEDILFSIKEILEDEGYKVDIESSAEKAIQLVKENDYDLVISDLKIPKITGDKLLKEVKKINKNISFIILTAYGSIDVAVSCMKDGAFSFLTKPIDFNDEMVWKTIQEAVEKSKLLKENAKLKEEFSKQKIDFIITRNPLMKEIINYIQKIANFDFTVLIYGESGTGKELIARAIHQLSSRRNKPFLAVNCAAISKDIMESEFFGVKKGVYTGADEDRKGILEQAEGGTVFLDEISELPLDIQGKLLRFLQDKEIRKIGDVVSKKVDVRVIAATNKDLKKLVQEGKFREDLYFRLEGLKIEIPPLRERKDDIPLLVYHFIDKFNKKYMKEIKGVMPDALEAFIKYKWEGNVRQLENVINEASILAEDYIEMKHLPEYIRNYKSDEIIFDYNQAKKYYEYKFAQNYFRTLLAYTEGNISQAAKLANIERQSLQKLLKKYNIDPSEFRNKR